MPIQIEVVPARNLKPMYMGESMTLKPLGGPCIISFLTIQIDPLKK